MAVMNLPSAVNDLASAAEEIATRPDSLRVRDLRERVRQAMAEPPVAWDCPKRIRDDLWDEPLAVRKARAIQLKLAHMPTDLWEGQLFAGSMTLESPRVHAERGFPEYTTEQERAQAANYGVGPGSVFGHIVPDYPTLLRQGLLGIRARAEAQQTHAATDHESAFLRSVVIALDAVVAFAERLAQRCDTEAQSASPGRAAELRQMADNLRVVPAHPAQTFWQALQSVWLLHMVFHSTMNNNALGRLDQYTWPYLHADLQAGRLTLAEAAELVDCFCLKFNERAKTTDEQLADQREADDTQPRSRTRHSTSSQLGTRRDSLDATNHWLQNIIIGGLTPAGEDGTNPVSFLLLESYRRNQMTNPLITLRLHANTPDLLLRRACEVLREGGGMPALFNDQALVPALERLGIPTPDARDYTNDGCWEVIIPGRTDFCFQRLSLMLCLEWALNRGRSRFDGAQEGLDTGDPREFRTFANVMQAFAAQVDAMVARTVERVMSTLNSKAMIAPVPLLSALLDGPIEKRRDMTQGGAKYRTYGLLAESAAHAIDSLAAIRHVVFDTGQATMDELLQALDRDFVGCEALRAKLVAAPKYGNDDDRADSLGREILNLFTESVARHAAPYADRILFPCGVATFSWYIGIGQGLGPSPDGRRAGEPVSSNFSPALGRDTHGLPSAILSYAKMPHHDLAVGGPLDLRISRRLVSGSQGLDRMVGLVRSFVELGGSMMTLTVVDVEELRAAQRHPERYKSLRVRMGGWCAYFTMLSREQQEHHIRRQEHSS